MHKNENLHNFGSNTLKYSLKLETKLDHLITLHTS